MNVEFAKPLRFRPFKGGPAALTSIIAADLWTNQDDKIFNHNINIPNSNPIFILEGRSGRAYTLLLATTALDQWAPLPLLLAECQPTTITITNSYTFNEYDSEGCQALNTHWEATSQHERMEILRPLTRMDQHIITEYLKRHNFIG